MTSLRVVRIYHSAVVQGFRARDHRLRALGVDETLVSPRRWNEGGKDVAFEPLPDERAWTRSARTFGRHPFRFVYNPVPIIRALRSVDPHVIDVHEEPASLAVAEVLLLRLLVCRRAAISLYSAENIEKRYPAPFRWLERRALRAAHTVYCCNSEAADIVRRKGFEGPTPVIGLGVDVDRFAPRSAPRADGRFVLGYVGRLDHRKGVHVVIAALGLLPPEVVLDVVGTGPERKMLETMAAPLGDRVRFRDFVPYDETPELYRGFDCVVMPSLPTPGWKEQFGRVAAEAMASGVPVVASAEGALPEVVGAGGILVPAADARVLAEAITQLFNDPLLHARYAKAGRERAQLYSWSTVAERHFEVYEAASL